MTAWTTDLETGYPELDAQHKKLFEMIHALSELIEGGPMEDVEVQRVVAFLESYARDHFACEERCMDVAKCPVRELNLEAHSTFLAGIVRFKQDYADHGEKREFLAILQASLRAWLRNHIQKVDTALRLWPAPKE